jgi:hypothetical protein
MLDKLIERWEHDRYLKFDRISFLYIRHVGVHM